MSVLLVALPIALALGALAVYGFVRAVRGGQFDDLDTPAMRVLHDDVDAGLERTANNGPERR